MPFEKKKDSEKRVKFSVSVSQDANKWVTSYAKRTGQTRSGIINMILEAHAKREDEGPREKEGVSDKPRKPGDLDALIKQQRERMAEMNKIMRK